MAKKKIVEKLDKTDVTLKKIMEHKCYMFVQQVRNKQVMEQIYSNYNYDDKISSIHLTIVENDENIGMEKKMYIPKNSTITEFYKLMFVLHCS